MLNLIKMDLHRLFHTKSFKVGLLLSAAASFIFIALIAGLLAILQEMLKNPESAEAVVFFPAAGWLVNGTSVGEIILTGFGAFSLLVSTILTAIFINSEQSSGYIKNIAGQVSNKGYMIVSKLFTIAVINLAIFAVFSVFSAVSGFVFLSYVIKSVSFLPFIPVLLIKFLLYMAIDAIILFICTLTKSKSFAVAVGVIFGIGITGFVYSALNSLITFITNGTDVKLATFTPDGINSILSINADAGLLIKAVVISVVYIAVFTIASSLVFKKRDV